jgi:excisionase family DNA binding protein
VTGLDFALGADAIRREHTLMEPFAITVDEAAALGGPRRAKLYEEINAGRLRAVKMGRCTRILVSDFQAYLTSLPAIEPRGATASEQREKAPGPARRRRRRRL